MEVLPIDLVRKCLVRVPYASHHNLKAVCRSWQAMVCSPNFYAGRKISGTSEQFICLIQNKNIHGVTRIYDPLKDTCKRSRNNVSSVITIYDPLNCTWKRIPPIDNPDFEWFKCVAVNGKLVLIAGIVLSSRTMKNVYIYDFQSGRWSPGADMPIPKTQSFFVCTVSSFNGLVYVAGRGPLGTAAAATYNVGEDKWEILPPMIQPHIQGCRGVFLEDKFMVLSRDGSVQVLDPPAGTWRRSQCIWSSDEKLWRSLWGICAADSSGNLYVFSEEQVMKYEGEKNVWTPVASLPEDIQGIRCHISCATGWHDWIFLSCATGWHDWISYLFSPSTSRWIKVNSDAFFVSATTVEI